jgi:hypothetical protein
VLQQKKTQKLSSTTTLAAAVAVTDRHSRSIQATSSLRALRLLC